MRYDSKSLRTNTVKVHSNKRLDVKSFSIPKEKYEDKRRVITRRFV